MSISILMTVRNEAKYLRACLDSICDQSFQDWELVVIDDHSEDKTGAILQEYVAKDTRIKWERNKEKGIIPALQQAFELSTGEFVTRMDGDDLMPSNKLAVLLDLLKDSNWDTVATGQVRYFGDTQVSEGYRRYEQWLNERCVNRDHWRWVYRECVIASPNWLCTRDLLNAMGGFKELNYPEDYDLVLKWYERGVQVRCTEEITHLWREHQERTSRNSPVYDQRSFFQLKINYLLTEFPTEHFVILGVGQKAKLCKDWLKRNDRTFDRLDQPELFSQAEQIEISSINTILLLAVYPDQLEREKLLGIMASSGFELGRNAFFV